MQVFGPFSGHIQQFRSQVLDYWAIVFVENRPKKAPNIGAGKQKHRSKTMRYRNFLNTAKPVDSLAPYNGDDDTFDFPGFVFLGVNGECYGQIQVDEGGGRADDTYHVIVGNQEIVTPDFDEATFWLWKNHSQHEVPDDSPKYAADGTRLTDCCGAMSTYSMDRLVCKHCFHPVDAGQGDGGERQVPLREREFDASMQPTLAEVEKIIESGFTDDSWHNNICVSFTRETYSGDRRITLWVDAINPADREMVGPRFVLQSHDEFDEYEELIETDDLDAALQCAEQYLLTGATK